MSRLIFYLLLLIPIGLWAQQDSLMIYYKTGIAAYETSDYQGFYKAFKRANEIRPGNPTLIYNLACGSALTGRTDHAFARLKEFLLMNATHDFSTDKDFKRLWDDPRFLELVELQIDLSDTIRTSNEAFKLEAQSFHPESITYCTKDNSFFFGDIRSRRIMKANLDGQLSEWLPTQQNMYAVMGIALNESKNELWAVTAALSEMVDYHDSLHASKSSMFVFDMTTKKLKAKWLFDNKVLGGITIGPKGNVLVSDLKHNQIWEIKDLEKGPILYKDLSGNFFNIQGMTYNKDGSKLYLSDYITGLYYLDQKKVLKTMRPPKNVSYKGIDGLYYHDGKLFATQNGTKPMRFYQFQLDTNGTKIESAKLVDQAGILNEPTTGTFTKDQFLFIANSPWGAYDKTKNFNPEGPVVILSQRLE
ncbi:MAG: hypothetical protein R8G66_07190 [Cytophagales bacterium]|nr:hypothetical protein [Cytophagales bacterium]